MEWKSSAIEYAASSNFNAFLYKERGSDRWVDYINMEIGFIA